MLAYTRKSYGSVLDEVMISVVMPVYLPIYSFGALDREAKFFRAVYSFLKQGLGELVVVSDGCYRSIEIVNRYIKDPSILPIIIPKQVSFSGRVRQTGISFAKYPWICYLDSDDEFMPGHLQTIVENLDDAYDWMYYDDRDRKGIRDSKVIGGQIGTSCIVHKRDLPVAWPDGYSHDWKFIQSLGPNYKKIPGSGYLVHHIPTQYDQ